MRIEHLTNEGQLTKELLDRLICAKQLLLHGQASFESRTTFSSGMAALSFQDAVEMLLRVIAEHMHCSVKDNTQFNHLMDLIDSKTDNKLTHRSALIQLNKARVNFKHYGLEPKEEDVIKFERDLDQFFPKAIRDFLGVDFDSVSLVHLIGHTRTENHMILAEEAIARHDYTSSILSAASAYEIFKFHHQYFDSYRQDYSIDFEMQSTDWYMRSHTNDENSYKWENLNDWARKIEKTLENHHRVIDLIKNGVSPYSHRKYKKIVPNIDISDAGTLWIQYLRSDPNDVSQREDAIFCKNFVIDSILKLKENGQKTVNHRYLEKSKLELLEDSDLIVYPSDKLEIITTAKSGDIFSGTSEEISSDEYTGVLFEDDIAYIRSSSVNLLAR